MDEVIARVVPKFLDIFEEQNNYRPTDTELHGKKVYHLPGGENIRKKLHDPGFFADLPVMPHSQEVLRNLHEHYEIYIVTAAQEFRNALPDKHDWLQKHFPFIHWKNYVFCGDKSIILADYLIDDHVFNLETFQGKGLLFSASHNLDENRFTRVNDWLEIQTFFNQQIDTH